MVQLTPATARVQNLREGYLSHSLMAMGEGRELHADYPAYGTRRLRFVEGWLKVGDCGTIRLRSAKSEAYMLRTTRPVIDDGELLVGQPDMDWTTVYTPEERQRLRDIYYQIIPVHFYGREGHMALDYEKLLRVGVNGLLEEMRGKLAGMDVYDAANYEAYEFYTCGITELEALLELAQHYAEHARALAETAAEPRRTELLEIAAIMERVPAGPAHTFREALQSIHFYLFNLLGLFSIGRLDQLLYPYYQADVQAGRLTVAQAQELIDCFCLLFATYVPGWAAAGFLLGGTAPDGAPVENELTWLFLNSISHTHLPDPGIGLCVNEHTGSELLHFAAELLADGETHPAIWNDARVISAMLQRGMAPEDARNYTHSTCVELTPIGCSGITITSPYVNTLQAFLDAFYTFRDGDSEEELLDKYTESLQTLFDRLLLEVNQGLIERSRIGTLDPARVSCLVRDCIARGKAIDEGGAVYSGVASDFLGMLNVVECFNVIHQLVYKERSVTMAALQQAVRSNYEDDPVLLHLIRDKVAHYGNDDPYTNALARRVADIACDCCARRRDIWGHPIVPGAFSYDNHVEFGALTAASPDGRCSGDALHDGSGPVQGYNISGPTATLQSVSAYAPSRFGGGIACNIKLNKNTKDLSAQIFSLICAFRQLDIPEMQISVTDNAVLREAQIHPEQYRDLLVRIGGFSDFFVRLDPRVQQEVIRRAEG